MSFTVSDLRRWWREAGLESSVSAENLGDEHESTPFQGLTYDSRSARPGTLFCGVAGERTHGVRFAAEALAAGSEAVLLEGSPREDRPSDLPSDAPCLWVSDARAALAAAARARLAEMDVPVIGITGSNGKTSTKDFTRAALVGMRVGSTPGNLNSGFGLPAAILAQPDGLDVLVLEMGASAPGEIARLAAIAPPRVGCVTNVAAAHLEFFHTLEGVAETKAALVEALPADGVAVLNRDDPTYDFFLGRSGAERTVSFGSSAEADVRVTRSELVSDGLRVEIGGAVAVLPVFGEINALNAAAAVAIAGAMGVAPNDALLGISRAALSPHRSRLLELDRLTVLDDCYNANPASVTAALSSLASFPAKGRRIAVLGDMAELGEEESTMHAEVLRRAVEHGLDRIHVVGGRMRRALAEMDSASVVGHENVDALVDVLLADRRPQDVVLVKASRSVGLERVVTALAERAEPAGGEHRHDGEAA